MSSYDGKSSLVGEPTADQAFRCLVDTFGDVISIRELPEGVTDPLNPVVITEVIDSHGYSCNAQGHVISDDLSRDADPACVHCGMAYCDWMI